ncbi:hypothetical protein V2J09_004864 [Rumex salicifolius]
MEILVFFLLPVYSYVFQCRYQRNLRESKNRQKSGGNLSNAKASTFQPGRFGSVSGFHQDRQYQKLQTGLLSFFITKVMF